MPRSTTASSGPPSETLDSILIDALPVAVYVCDRDARIVRFNQHAVELWGREPIPDDRYCASLYLIRADGTILPHHECPVADVLRTGEAVRDAEVSIERPDGSRIAVRITSVPLTDAAGSLTGVLNTFRDITTEKQTQADLRDFVENATEGLHWVGPDGTVLWANQAELDMLGYTRDEYIGHNIAEFHADREAIDRILNCLSARQTLHNAEARMRCKDGSIRHVIINSNVLWRDGIFIHTRCFTRDVTEIRRLADAVRRGEDRLRLAARATHAAVYEMDFRTGEFQFDDDVRDLLGHVPRAIPTTIDGVMRFWSDHLHPDDVQATLEAYGAWLQNAAAERWSAEYRLQRADGTFGWVAERALIERDEGGRPARLIGALHDVTERKQVENALRHQTELLKTVADNAASMIVMVDAQGRATYMNPEAMRLTGYSADELIGHVLHDRIHHQYPDGRPHPRSECALDRALALGEPVREMEEVLVRRDGTFFPVVCSAMPIVRDGKAVGTVIEARDITERKRADRALRLSEERFRSLSKCLPVGIFQNDIDGKCTYTNPRAAAICGFTFEESLGEGWSSFVHPEDRERLYRSWMAAVTERREWLDENRWLHHDNTVRWTICRAAPHLNDAGEVIGYIGTLEDMTERKEAEELLREMDRRKDAFVATVAHELRQPLHAIQTALELMRLRVDRDKGEKARSTVERQIAQLARLVDDLLDASRISRGNVSLQRRRITLHDIIDTAIDIVQPLVLDRGQELRVAFATDAVVVEADPQRLQQVFSNLLTNAAKFTPRDGRIDVAVDAHADVVTVRVRDTGCGITRDMLPHVFDLFAQASQDGGGLGIGLAVVRGLVEAHGGSIHAHSDGPGQGSEFIVTLPVVAERLSS